MEETWPQLVAAAPPVIYVFAYLVYVVATIGDGTSKRLRVMQRESDLIQSLPDQLKHRELLLSTLSHRIEAHHWKTVRRVDGASAAALILLLGILGAVLYALIVWGMAVQNLLPSLVIFVVAALVGLTALGVLAVGLGQLYVDPTGKRRDGTEAKNRTGQSPKKDRT
ncbi:hypothetical protein [Nesterenkonia alba]|uniref:hypothetical protein n=1 Tax=Nesterenkonia alba TaxID=515814 RepID=UPI0012EBE9C2|nr:hypothetical protein [Nesterenkonia alba]